MDSGLFRLDMKDIAKGLVMAAIGGFLLPIAAAIQTPGFDLVTANWQQILVLAENGAAVAFIGYIIKNFFSDSQGKVLGAIG